MKFGMSHKDWVLHLINTYNKDLWCEHYGNIVNYEFKDNKLIVTLTEKANQIWKKAFFGEFDMYNFNNDNPLKFKFKKDSVIVDLG